MLLSPKTPRESLAQRPAIAASLWALPDTGRRLFRLAVCTTAVFAIAALASPAALATDAKKKLFQPALHGLPHVWARA